MDTFGKLVEVFDNSSISTQIVLLCGLVVTLFFCWKVIEKLADFFQNGLKAEKILEFFETLIKIIPLEWKTIAGIINLLTSIGLILATILIFLSNSVAGFFGFNDHISIDKWILLFVSILVSVISLWGLYKYDRESTLLSSKSEQR